MPNIELAPHQRKAVRELHNGAILKGGVGTGKTRTAMYYYITAVCNGRVSVNGVGDTVAPQRPRDIYVITTAKKRDDLDWEQEAARFGVSTNREISLGGVQIKVDSWNNIENYTGIKHAFFVFDEQRLVGSGAWVKAFYKIAEQNEWIMASATPGDTWMEYIPVFVANGYYKNRTEFIREHVIFKPFSKFPKIDRYVNQGRLIKYRKEILVEMPFKRHTVRHVKPVITEYDRDLMKRAMVDRWHVYEERPIRDVGELFIVMRKIVNSDPDRITKVLEIQKKHPRLIIFYNFNYELENLRTMGEELGIPMREWNGHKHEAIPDSDSWIYLVQYTAGAEGWNCVTTDAMVYFSLNYSWKINEQGKGRIDRMNTPYKDLHYYILRSDSAIDTAITRALAMKQNFNEKDLKLV